MRALCRFQFHDAPEGATVGAAAGVCYGSGEPVSSPTERIPDRRESHPTLTSFPTRLRLSDPEGSTLAEIGKRLGRKDLQLVASVALPDTILAWYR